MKDQSPHVKALPVCANWCGLCWCSLVGKAVPLQPQAAKDGHVADARSISL